MFLCSGRTEVPTHFYSTKKHAEASQACAGWVARRRVLALVGGGVVSTRSIGICTIVSGTSTTGSTTGASTTVSRSSTTIWTRWKRSSSSGIRDHPLHSLPLSRGECEGNIHGWNWLYLTGFWIGPNGKGTDHGCVQGGQKDGGTVGATAKATVSAPTRDAPIAPRAVVRTSGIQVRNASVYVFVTLPFFPLGGREFFYGIIKTGWMRGEGVGRRQWPRHVAEGRRGS